MTKAPPELPLGTEIAKRYRVLRVLGQGGMACVYEVADAESGTTLALKRLLPEAASQQRATLLFRREYNTLTQLAHPFIVRAFDYGLDKEVPYYTMELVAGEDLRSLVPMGWQRACSVLRDVASALSIVHSRRLLHRDVTARNVRCTTDGSVKLLDFGALCPMGLAQEVAGTPPFVSPESFSGQALDARSDLFSLGALAYYLLTGSHAYPAACLSDLHAVWSRRLEAPSRLAPDVPPALSSLVVTLLDLNPLARPASAAEVSERLTAIAQLPPAGAPDVARAYLSTPLLIGREDALARFRRRMLRAERRRGSALLIEGASGSGRSRLLTSLLTEARQNGFVALYALGAEGRKGAFAVARALVNRLLKSQPDLKDAPARRPELQRFLNREASAAEDSIHPDGWPAAVAALAEWFRAVSFRVPLVVAVDDMDDTDPPSLALLAKLMEAAPNERLLVVLTSLAGSTQVGQQRFKRLGGALVLKPFRLVESKQLVSSIFGEVPHLEAVTGWVHRLSAGNPRIALELLQHLVDQGVVRYEQGGWMLPVTPEGLNLPQSLDQALDEKLANLTPVAREFAECLALTARHEPLFLEEYPALIGGAPELVLSALNELVCAGVLVRDDVAYAFPDQSIRQALLRHLPAERASELQRRLARAYAADASEPSALAAYHLYLAGDERAAFTTLIACLALERSRSAKRGKRLIRSPEGARFIESMFEWGIRNEAPSKQLTLFGRFVLGLASAVDAGLVRHAPAIFQRLERDSGLVHWQDFAGLADPLERVRACMARAFEAHAACPEHERGLDPLRAVQEYAVCTAMLAGVLARANDPDSIVALTARIERLRPLSPAVDVIANLITYSAHARRGWAATDLRLRVLEQLQEPVAGIDEVSRDAIRVLTQYYQALEEAALGEPALFERLKILEGKAPYAPLAWQVRLIAHLFQGAEKQADYCRTQRDLALVGRLDVDQQLETSVALESTAYIILGDLMALKRMLPVLEELAGKWPGWAPQYLLVQGAYHGVRGDLSRALELSRRALDLVTPAGHATWAIAAMRVVRLLVQLGRATEAHELASASVALSQQHPVLAPFVDQLEMALALAEAHAGDGAGGIARAERVAARAEQCGSAGILLIELYALQAQIAQLLNDVPRFEQASEKISTLCTRVESAAFASKLSSLLNLPLGAGFEPLEASAGTLLKKKAASSTLLGSKVRTELELCRSAEERAKRALGLVLYHSRVKQGFLYLNQASGPVLAASRCASPPPIEAEEHVLKWISDFRGTHDEFTTATTSGDFDVRFRLIGMTTQRDGEVVVAAVALLDCGGRQPKSIPDTVLTALAQALLDAGDTTAIHAVGA